jgi:aryl-alcohol dehydrogenase-like predicted oxidoreductase
VHRAVQAVCNTILNGCTYVLAQKPWIVPIPGTTKLHRMTENNGAVSIKLTAQELQEIEKASSEIQVIGTRYTEQMERFTGL